MVLNFLAARFNRESLGIPAARLLVRMRMPRPRRLILIGVERRGGFEDMDVKVRSPGGSETVTKSVSA